MPLKEITLAELVEDFNWASVFGEETNGGNTSNHCDPCPPESTVDTTPPTRADVAEIIAAVNGENDEESWLGVFLLKDGRYLLACGSCDYTGWD